MTNEKFNMAGSLISEIRNLKGHLGQYTSTDLGNSDPLRWNPLAELRVSKESQQRIREIIVSDLATQLAKVQTEFDQL